MVAWCLQHSWASCIWIWHSYTCFAGPQSMDQLPLPFGHSTWPCGTRSWPHEPLLMMSTASPLLNAFVSHNLIIFYFSLIQLPRCKLYFAPFFLWLNQGGSIPAAIPFPAGVMHVCAYPGWSTTTADPSCLFPQTQPRQVQLQLRGQLALFGAHPKLVPVTFLLYQASKDRAATRYQQGERSWLVS